MATLRTETETIKSLQGYFVDLLSKRDHGLVPIASQLDWPIGYIKRVTTSKDLRIGLPFIIVGIADHTFMAVYFGDDGVVILARLPILNEAATPIWWKCPPSGLLGYCIKLDNCYRKKAARTPVQKNKSARLKKKLLDHFDAQGIAPDSTLQDTCPKIFFDYNHPESMHALEYYINKIITIVVKKVRKVGDEVFLRDRNDLTNIIDLATEKWELNKPATFKGQ